MCAAARVEGIHTTGAFAVGPFSLVHAMADNRRTYERLPLSARVRLKRVAGRPEAEIREHEGLDISCGGVRFQSERSFPPGTDLDLEVILLDRQQKGSSVKMFTSGTVIRSDKLGSGKGIGVAVLFTDIVISRDSVR